MAFVDRVQVTLKAGDGGDGIVSFRHEKFIDKGGPDGGDGGDGGNIVLVASRNQNTLAAFRYQKLVKANNGKPGTERRRHGKSAGDLEVFVPVGTTVIANEEVLADLTEDGQSIIIAKGGKGGFGNAHFKSSTRQAPRVAEKGEKGEQVETIMELKMIADVGIVGLPNAGKSTLLSVISNAKPEIADYPFTTLSPNLGVVDIDGKQSLLFADIPGLIEGASQGRGLGDEFLRHIERTSVLIHLIDAYSENVAQDYRTIMKELADYRIDLSTRPQIVALTKTEGINDKELQAKIKKLAMIVPRGTTVLAISSASGEGTRELLRAVLKLVEKTRKKMQTEEKKAKLPVIGLKESPDDWKIEKTTEGFLVKGKRIERFASRTIISDFYGEQRLRDIMRKMGIMTELQRRGIEAGQKIQIGIPQKATLDY